MNRFRSFVLLTAALLSLACRHPVPPPVAPSAVPPEVVTEAPAQRVEPPSQDFKPPTPAPADEVASAGIAELNRLAHERGWVHDAYFDYDRNALTGDAQQALNDSAQWLRAHGDITVVLEGHCDERGTEQYNLGLGDRRANTAREYLVAQGVDAGRIKTVSYGEERPFEDGHAEEAWAKNRRAHFVLAR